MEVPIAIDLVEQVLSEHFGKWPAAIFVLLVRRGPSAIYEILDALRIEFWQIRNSLLILLQHSVVNSRTDEGKIVKYSPNVSEALLRVRLARFAYLVTKRRGAYARLLFTQVLKTGMTNMNAVVTGVLEDYDLQSQQHKAHAMEDDDDENDEIVPILVQPRKEKLELEFVCLVAENFLARVEVESPDPTNVPTEPPTSARSNPTFSVSLPAGKSLAKAAAKPAAKKRALTPSGRKKKPTVDAALMAIEKESLAGSKVNADGSNIDETEDDRKKRLSREDRDRSAQLKELMRDIMENKVVFRVNIPHLNLLLFREIAEDFMCTRWADSRAVRLITRALLANSRMQTTRVITTGLKFDELKTALSRFQKDDDRPNSGLFRPPEKNIILQLLDTLGRTDKLIRNVTKDGSAIFIFDWDKFKELIQQRVLFNYISSGLGVTAGRVWNLLLSGNASATTHTEMEGGKLWEDQQIADQALMPPHMARSVLYKLTRAGYVRFHQSDVVSGAPTPTASKHSIVYATTEAIGKNNLLQKLYNMHLNVLQRKQYEAKRIANLVFRVTGLTETEDFQLRQREAGEDQLEYSFLELDESMLILRDM